MVLPSPYLPKAHAVGQTLPTTWSPFGPRTKNLVATVYGDFTSMFTAFTQGLIDLPDWPIPPSNIPSYLSNPDFFVTSPQPELSIFELDINHHAPFLGVSGLVTRTTTTPGIIGTPTATPGCSTLLSRLVVNLVNKEEGNSPIKDPLNKVIASGPQTFTVTDSGGSNPNGTYVLPSPTGCMPATTYTLTTSLYTGTAKVSIGSGQIVTVTFGVNYNSPSTLKETQAGIEIRRALAHLLDKPSFVQGVAALQGQAACDDIFVSPALGLSGSCNPTVDRVASLPQALLDEDLAEHQWTGAQGVTHEVSAYNLHTDAIGGNNVWWGVNGASGGANAGYSGVADLPAACDHFALAGFAITRSSATCADVANASVGATAPSGPYPHLVPNGQIVLILRLHPPRKAFGLIIGDSIDFLFGTPNGQGPSCTVLYAFLSSFSTPSCTPFYYSSSQISSIVFSGTDLWNLYTGAFFEGPTPDVLYFLMHSQFAGTVCGGPKTSFPANYVFHCDPSFDTQAAAGEFSSFPGEANNLFFAAAVIGHRTVMNIPVYTPIIRSVALNGWNFQGTSIPSRSSLVSVLGQGWEAGAGFWSLLNMRQLPFYTPASPQYAPGGGNPSLIRRGFSQGTMNLSPFRALSFWETEVLSLVYDTLLQVNPLTGGSITGGTSQQIIDWMTTKHSSSFNASSNVTTQKWTLRNDLFWQDGQRVTADDVVFTILAYRDVPSSEVSLGFLPGVASVIDASTLSPDTVQVHLTGQSQFFELDIGRIPIIPHHVWAGPCNWPVGSPDPGPTVLSASSCASPSFDPMASGIMIGSGPWLCKNINTGAIGGSCTQNPDNSIGTQSVFAGGKLIFTANDGYFRGRPGVLNSNLNKFSWADKNNDGVVNILDVADAALHFGQPDPYWNSGQNPMAPSVGTDPSVVDIGELATVVFYFDQRLTAPFTPSQLTGLDPCIDPFFQSSPPC